MRKGPSIADQQLIEHLASRGLAVSADQLERWRRAGPLPRNTHRGRGRGRGSVSTLDPATVEIAAALARHSRQGRDLRITIVDWFADAGRNRMPGRQPVPEPPDAAVHAAMVWMTETGPYYRLLAAARSAQTEAEKDKYFATAAGANWPQSLAPLDPDTMRQSLLAGEDLPDDENSTTPARVRTSMIQLTAAIGMGLDEVGVDALAEALGDLDLLPNLTASKWRMALTNLEQHPNLLAAMNYATTYDPLLAVQRATAQQLRQAREVAYDLAGFGAICLFHGLLMPDTPGLSALRARIDQYGVRAMLLPMAFGMNTTRSFASHVVSCLAPWISALRDDLREHVLNGPPLFGGPDSEHTAKLYMNEWESTIRNLTNP